MLKGLEEILAKLELGDEVKTALAEQVNGLADGLVTKNNELLQKLQERKDAGTASAAELEALRQFKENADMDAAAASKNWDETKRLMEEKHTKEMAALQERVDKAEKLNRNLLVDNGLSTVLDELKVNPALKAGVIALLQGGCEIVDGKAMVGEESLSDHVKGFAESETGKAYFLAANNSGGGSNGSGGGNLDQSKKWTDYKPHELSQIRRENPTEYDRLKDTRPKTMPA